MITKRLSAFENAYLARSLNRVFDPINVLFQKLAVAKTMPEASIVALVNCFHQELESVAFDSALSKTIGRNVSKAIKLFLVRCENSVRLCKSDGVVPD